MQIPRTRPATLAVGLALVSVCAWQAWALVGDGAEVSAVTSGGGFASSHPYGLGGSIGQPVVEQSTGGGFVLHSGLWAPDTTNPVRTDTAPQPGIHRLIGAYPNPFNPRTEVRFELGDATRVLVQVHDVRGRLIRTLIDEPRSAGPHSVTWDGKDNRGTTVASGTYYLRFNAGDRVDTRKVALLK